MCALRLRLVTLISLTLLWAVPALCDDLPAAVETVPVRPAASARVALTKPEAVSETIVQTLKGTPRSVLIAKPPAQKAPVAHASVAKVRRQNSPVTRIDRADRPAAHVVRRGDWLSKIAVRYGMSVQEIMDLNGLPDDSIDIGATLRLRPSAVAPLQPLVASGSSAGISETAATVVNTDTAAPRALTMAGTVATANSAATVLPAAAGSTAPAGAAAAARPTNDGQPSPTTVAAEGLTAAQLVGDPRDPIDSEAAAATSTNVTMPTPQTGSVNPLSRARIALALALVMLGLLSLHPRSRSVVLDRLPALNLRTSKARDTLAAIEMHASRRVGSNQQVMLLEVSGTRLLIGVSEGRMELLHRWDDLNGGVSATEPQDLLGATSSVATSEQDSQSDPNPNHTRTLRQPSLEQEPTAAAPTLTPNAEQLLDTWRQNPATSSKAPDPSADDLPWWMEGASAFERTHIGEDEVESIRVQAPKEDKLRQRDRVEESVLATLRNQRVRQDRTAQSSERGTHPRPAANAHAGFRSAARLGRQPSLGARREQPSVNTGAEGPAQTDQAKSPKGRGRGPSNMSFQL